MVAERATSRRTPRVAHRASHTVSFTLRTASLTPRVAHSKFYTAHSKFYTASRTQLVLHRASHTARFTPRTVSLHRASHIARFTPRTASFTPRVAHSTSRAPPQLASAQLHTHIYVTMPHDSYVRVTNPTLCIRWLACGPSLQTSGMVFKNVRIGSKCSIFVTHAYFRK